MFTTSRRHHAPPLASSSSHQQLQHQPIAHSYHQLNQSAPPTPSNAHIYSPSKSRPATASNTSTPSARALTSAVSSSSFSSSPSPSPSPLISHPSALHLTTMPHSSHPDSYSASPILSPLSSGLPSPTFPPSRLGFAAPSANAQIPHRSAVINIGSPLTSSATMFKDDFDYRRSPQPPTRLPPPVPTQRQYSSSVSNALSGSASDSTGSTAESSPPTSPRSVRSRTSSTMHEDVLVPGDLVGEGLFLQGDALRRVDTSPQASGLPSMDWKGDLDHMLGLSRKEEIHIAGQEEPTKEFEVVRKLGSGSYAVVYLVREVLSRQAHAGVREKERSRGSDEGCFEYTGDFWDDDLDDEERREQRENSDPDSDDDGFVDWRTGADGVASNRFNGSCDGPRRRREKRVYGREYAVKCLSKAGMDEDALRAQMVEANIHQSLPAHPNIVTLHRTLETRAFLLLVLEYVPGEDLFYFLEQARDHYEPNTANQSRTDVASVLTMSTTCTPPTPSLLATLNERQLLSKTRLKLISSMFAQMCEAVAVCHDVGVYHRDIKPENFIVTDGWAASPHAEQLDEDDEDFARERRVVVKLTDFGLSTRDAESGDMDCGSAPYMSFECRNNCAPTYAPRVADVWSLGIVLINMLYHINPWSDAAEGVCPSFTAYRQQPEAFFLQRFSGMTPAVAHFLTQRVFCILPQDDPLDHCGTRASARELARWIRDLPKLLAREGPVGVPPVMKEAERVLAHQHQHQHQQHHQQVEEESALSSPISPLSAISNATTTTAAATNSLLAQSLAQAFAQQEQAAAHGASGGPSSPAWRHRRGLSNASIGFPLSSVPQSRRPSSRQASFSIPGLGPVSMSMSGSASASASAAGSRATTPLLRGRTLTLSLLGPGVGVGVGGMSRNPSGSREPLPVQELPTVFDEEAEGDVSSGTLGLSHVDVLHGQSGGYIIRERAHEHENENEQDAENDNENENERDNDQEQDELAGSRSQSMVRRRKRGARKGKGQLIQQQQEEIARLQEKQADLQAQLERLANAVAAQQTQTQTPLAHALPVSPLSPNLLPPSQQQQQLQQSMSVTAPLSPVGPYDPLDTLASASEALARELSRTSRSNSQSHSQSQQRRAPIAPIPLPLALCTGNAHTLAASTSARGSRSNSVNNVSVNALGPHPHPHPHPHQHQHSPHQYIHHLHNNNNNSSNGLGLGLGHGYAVRAGPGAGASAAGRDDASPGRIPSAAAGGPTPGALYPVVFPASSMSSAASTTTTTTTSSLPSGTSEAAAYASSIVSASSVSSATTAASAPPTIAKKTSKWKLSFGKSSSAGSGGNNSNNSSNAPSRPPIPAMQSVLDISRKNSEVSLGAKSAKSDKVSVVEDQQRNGQQQPGTTSATARSVANVLMGLESSVIMKSTPSAAPSGLPQTPAMQPPPTGPIPPVPSQLPSSPPATNDVWSRGRRPAGPTTTTASTWGPSHSERERWAHAEQRNTSPNSTRTGPVNSSGSGSAGAPAVRGAPVASSASSVSNSSYSSNWRNSAATGSSASSAFTRFSNGSVRSVSTVATSVSAGSAAGSWRNHSSSNGHAKPGPGAPPSVSSRNSDARIPPPNVKIMTGVPYCLDEYPRQLSSDPVMDLHPPPRKQRVRKPKDLPTINERPSAAKSPLSQRFDAGRSSSDLHSDGGRNSRDGAGAAGDDGGESPQHEGDRDGAPRKVQKGQINALAKMLSALRR